MSTLTAPEQQRLNDLLTAAGQLLVKTGRSEVTFRFGATAAKPAVKLPSICLNTMPKSASIFIQDVLHHALGLERIRISGGYFPDDLVVPAWLDVLAQGHRITQEHLPARALNLRLLGRHMDRLVLHVRDPRQATLSWTHHVATLARNRREAELAMIDPVLPQDYFDRDLSGQLDWQIDTHLPALVSWTEGWLDVIDADRPPLAILLTRFEDFRADQKGFFTRLLAFHGLEGELMRRVEAVLDRSQNLRDGQAHFREGRTSEWREVFTAAQRDRAAAHLGQRLPRRLGYAADG